MSTPGHAALDGASRRLVMAALVIGAVMDVAYWVLWFTARDTVASPVTDAVVAAVDVDEAVALEVELQALAEARVGAGLLDLGGVRRKRVVARRRVLEGVADAEVEAAVKLVGGGVVRRASGLRRCRQYGADAGRGGLMASGEHLPANARRLRLRG